MRHFLKLGLVSAALTCAVTAAMAQDEPTGENLCEARDSSAVISVALCPEGLTKEDLSAAGTAICDKRLPCGVWFWTDEANMPSEAPDNHDGLTQEQITSALAVWVAEKNSLISIADLKASQ